MTNQNLTKNPDQSEEQEYLLTPLTTTDGDNSNSHASPQPCRARITCDECGTYDDFIYEELSPARGWRSLCGQGVYQCQCCDAVYTLDDIFPENTFPSAWVYWRSKEKAISHLSWLDNQATSTPETTMTNNNPSNIYEVASQLARDGFEDSNISISDGILSVSLLSPFRQFENGRYADSCKTTGFAFKSAGTEQLIFSVRLYIASHPYNQSGEPDVPAIQSAASKAPALVYLQPQNYILFLNCLRQASELLEAQLVLTAERIMEEIGRNQGTSTTSDG